VLEGFEPDSVRASLGQVFKLEGGKLAALFSGQRVVINRSIANADAPLHVARFAKLGARMHIEASVADAAPAAAALPSAAVPVAAAAGAAAAGAAGAAAAGAASAGAAAGGSSAPAGGMPPAVVAPAEEEVVCPNCGERQSRRVLCRACATNIPMGMAAKLEAGREARVAELAERRARRGLPLEGGASAVAADAPPLWGLGSAGRMGRLPYAAAGLLLLTALCLLAAFMLQRPSGLRLAVFALGVLVILFVSVRATVLRCHDCNRSGWWSLLMLVPYLDIVAGLLLSFFPGTVGDNDHGGPPREGSLPLTLLSAAALLASLVLTGALLLSVFTGSGPGSEEAAAVPADSAAPGLAAAPVAGSTGRLSAQAQAAFDADYTPAPGHKAFAVSAGGAWGWKSGAASADDAMDAAVANCEATRKPDTPECEPVNVDGQWGSLQPP
jgi:uncharacterized membrane protein YhaH (DUF805 family)